MKKVLLISLLFLGCQAVQAQLPTNSFAVTSACSGDARNSSLLQKVNTDGSLTPIGTVTDGGTPIVVNALGFDDANLTVLYGQNVVQPINAFNFNTPPNLYQINLTTAQATNLGAITPPPTPPAAELTPPGFGETASDLRQTLNFIGDGGSNSEYFVAGATFRVMSRFLIPNRITDLRLYVGVVQLGATPNPNPTWRRLVTSDLTTTAVIEAFQEQVRFFITSGGNTPIPQGGIQDWVYDPGRNVLVSYLGQTQQYLTISNPASAPVAATTPPPALNPQFVPLPNKEDVGAMFRDRRGSVYTIGAESGIISRINPITGSYERSFGSIGCSRGDAVSLPGALPLPVTLTRFAATSAPDGVRLSWATASEQQASHFVVERSASGAAWQPVLRVNAGNKPHGQSYTALDASPLPGTSYYRLAMYDLDGSVAYSAPQTVGRAGATALTVFPNPAHDQLRVLLPTEEAATLELYSAQGQLVKRWQPAPGSADVQLSTEQLPGGFYTLRVQQAGSTRTARVLLAGQ